MTSLSLGINADSTQTGSSSGSMDSVKKTWHGKWQMNTDVEWNRYNKIQLDPGSECNRRPVIV
jgi:hypothetical protein